jgi:glycosyltransferase involved in cell wall biosynthesis
MSWSWFQGPCVQRFTPPFDVFHATNYRVPPLRRSKAVLSVYDLFFLDKSPKECTFEERLFRRTVPRQALSSDRVIVLTRHMADQLIQRLGIDPKKLVVIPGAPDPDWAPPSQDQVFACRMKWGLDKPYVLQVGLQTVRKDLSTLIQAVPSLSSPEVHLVLAGREGPATPLLKSLVRELGLGTRVRFLGYVPREDLPGLYAGASCFAMSSLEEGFGLPVLEAMVCGVPVVASDVGALKEVVGEAGILASPGNPIAWGSALRDILDNPGLRQNLIQSGFRRASEFSWDKAAMRTAEVYRSLR